MEAVANHTLAIAEVIRLAVAPVFLLSGVGIVLTVLTNRLARVVDRARNLESRAAGAGDHELQEFHEALLVLKRRARLLNIGISLLTLCALLVAFVIIALFLAQFYEIDLSRYVSWLFVLAMLSFVGSLLTFLREVFLATQALRIGLKRRR
ncbi:MAG: DUF2721 domain-containing protein [Steroidobacteraceae bacterium]